VSAKRLIAAGLGFAWFLIFGGGPTLNPLNVSWLLEGDWLQHWMGFQFFQRDPWTFPLGSIQSLMFPVGTNIGFTDSNPLLALAMKPFSGWLPHEYQLIGLWFAACFALQGYMGAALASVVTRNAGQQVLGALLIVLSPVLIARIGHDTLCAQWLPIGILYLGLREYDTRSAQRAAWKVVAGVWLAATIHPYLSAMCWALGSAALLRLRRERWLTPRRWLVSMVLLTGGMIGIWSVIGYLSAPRYVAGGFGALSFDLLGFFNPRGFSRVLPDLPSLPSYEGFAFLGLGGLAVFVVAVIAFARYRPRPHGSTAIVFAVAALLAVFALSSSVTIGGNEVLSLRWLYQPLDFVATTYRASGRFIWPLHYLLLVFGVWGVARIAGEHRLSLGTALLGIAVAVQVSDLETDRTWTRPRPLLEVPAAPFELSRGHYRHLALAPMQVGGVCVDPFQEAHVFRFMRLASRLGLTYNSGTAARVNWPAVRAACDDQDRAIEARELDAQTIYIAAPETLPLFKAAGASCGRWDGNWICVSGSSNGRFRRFIETGKDILK
jgi:Family of unknown function (DUF6311)